MIGVTFLKIILAVVMVTLTLVFGLAPIRVLKYLRKSAAGSPTPNFLPCPIIHRLVSQGVGGPQARTRILS